MLYIEILDTIFDAKEDTRDNHLSNKLDDVLDELLSMWETELTSEADSYEYKIYRIKRIVNDKNLTDGECIDMIQDVLKEEVA